MKVVTWNVNSIRSRLERVRSWLSRHRPDVLCLQETKTIDGLFPREPLEELGYHVETFGQPTYNGVAILSLEAPESVHRGLPGDPGDEQKRLIAARIAGIDIINIYVPNGSEPASPKFAYKMTWMRRLAEHLQDACDPDAEIVLCGDFNVAFEDRDVHDPELWRGHVLFHPDERAAARRLLEWGLVDTLRLHHPEGGLFSWWDYRAGAFRRNRGLRIDHLLATRRLAGRCQNVTIDRDERKGEKPSDHAPVMASFAAGD